MTTPPASTTSTQLVLTNLLLALADLADLGALGALALVLTLTLMPWLVGGLRMKILQHHLAKAGHAAHDLCVLNNKGSQMCLMWIPWFLTRFLTWFFSCFCSFIQSFQLQSSKVSVNSNMADMHFVKKRTPCFLIDTIMQMLIKYCCFS